MIIFILANFFLNNNLFWLSPQMDLLLPYHREQYLICFLLIARIILLFRYFSQQESVGNCFVLLIFLLILGVLFPHWLYSNQSVGSFFGVWNKCEGFKAFLSLRICVEFVFFYQVIVKKPSWRFGFGVLYWAFGTCNAQDGLIGIDFRKLFMVFEWNVFFVKMRFWCHFFVLFIKICN